MQIVAASFHAMHAVLSPALYGNDPPTCVGAVMLYEVVKHPAIGDAHPWYSVGVEQVPADVYTRRLTLVAQVGAGATVQDELSTVPSQLSSTPLQVSAVGVPAATLHTAEVPEHT